MPAVFDDIFARARAQSRLALGLYLIPGFPNREESRFAVRHAVALGVDFIEFPVLGNGRFTSRTGSTIARILREGSIAHDPEWLSAVNTGVGVVYDGAWPSPERWDAHEDLLHRAHALLMEADVPDIEAWAGASEANWGRPVVTTVDARRDMLASLEERRLSSTSPFIYMSLGRRTGERSCNFVMMRRKVLQMRVSGCRTPVCAAFGIRTPRDVAAVRQSGCDGIIIGSAALEALERGPEFFVRWLGAITAACAADMEPALAGQ
jgi:Tryptophan synthase alpha chain